MDRIRSFPLTNRLLALATNFKRSRREHFDFKKITWAKNTAKATGMTGPTHFEVAIHFRGQSFELWPSCSLCGSSIYCPHFRELVVLMVDGGIAAKIEKSASESQSYDISKLEKQDAPPAWKTQLGSFVQNLQYHSTPKPYNPPRFPANREAIYVIQFNRYYTSNSTVQIQLATRVVPPSDGAPLPPRRSNDSQAKYRGFTNGVSGLALSADPLDRDVAQRISLVTHPDERPSGSTVFFTIRPESSIELLAQLARSGRLYLNSEFHLHDNLLRLKWLTDDYFELKFEIAGREGDQLALGMCVASPQVTISSSNIKEIGGSLFIDKENRLGIFRSPPPYELISQIRSRKPLLVPRAHASELIEQVLSTPLGLGIEFIDCDDIRPTRTTCEPRPRVHVNAGRSSEMPLALTLSFDYDGLHVPRDFSGGEIFDKRKSAMVQIDHAFHERSVDLLCSLGVKQVRHADTNLVVAVKKLPALVGQLIDHGWHVEADGKMYRSASRVEVSVVSGIDWFELQGDVRFEETSVDFPRLLSCLRAGERSVVLDDGTIGVIPDAWIARFRGIAHLAAEGDGSLKFAKAQVGLLDALLAEQGEFNVDKQFSAARESLRAFDRIQPQEPPTGFIGTLRPYQKLAQGWFEFLRNLGFGGCLADDMGLGKTIQVLSLLEHRRQSKAGPSLIVVPRSLIFNWTAEAKKFAPNIRVLDQSHSQRLKGTDHLSDFDLVLTTYGTLRRDAAFLKDFEFDYVVLDEAQAIKNADTEAAKAVRLLKGKHKLALSGTPIENHLGELWSLFDFLNPGMLGRIGRFAGLARDSNTDERKLIAASVRPFILRRTKKQVAPELPERVEQTIVVELDTDQRKAYDELRDYYRLKLMSKIDEDGIGKSQIVILEALLRLRQAACHPGLIDKARVDDPSAKLEELLSRLTSVIESGERVLVFSQFTSLLAIVKKRLKAAKIEFLYLDGKTKNRQALVEQFQSGTGPAVFLISLKAGGVGLNLTAARNVYLLDPWWNPAVEAQAIDRTHRIGQQQTVFATRLISADTVEQKVLELQAKKKGLAEAIINADNAGVSSLTREDLQLLLA